MVCLPEVVTDQEQYTKLMKELKQLTPVVEKFREYKSAKETNEESRAMLDEGGMDSDFAEMVKEEFEQSKEDINTPFHSLLQIFFQLLLIYQTFLTPLIFFSALILGTITSCPHFVHFSL